MFTIDMSPVALAIGPLTIRWYSLMVMLAVVVLLIWMLREVKHGAKFTADDLFSVALIAIISGVVVSRLLHVIDSIVIVHFQPAYASGYIDYLANPAKIIGGEGMAIWGAILGAALGVWIYSRYTKFRFGYFADLAVPGLILAQSLGRVGCTINGCCYGDVTHSSWSITYFHPDSVAGQLGTPYMPTQIYEIAFLLAVLPLMLWLRRRLQPDGAAFAVYLGLYSLWRFGIGFVRAGAPFAFGLEQSQVVSIIVLAISVIVLVRARFKPADPEIVPEALPVEDQPAK